MKELVIRIDRKVFAVLLLIFGLYFAFTHDVKIAHASVNPSGLTAKYGCLVNRNTSAFSALMTGHSGKEGTNMIMNIDYGTNTISAVLTGNQYYNSNNAITVVGTGNGTFSETVLQGVVNTFKVVSTFPGDNNTTITLTYYITPVNSGNTFLLSSAEDGQANAPWSGVCQKV